MAPLTRRQKKILATATAPSPPAAEPVIIDPADRISRLPPEIQAEILSYLPAQEGVRACVLSRTWRERQVWKFTRRLLITADSVRQVRELVDRLLRDRLHFQGASLSLDASEIRFDLLDGDYDDELDSVDREVMSCVNRWIQQVLECRIQMLRIDICTRGGYDGYLEMMRTLVSRHLTRLELTGVWFCFRCLNLDGCPVLEHLQMNECSLLGLRKIMSVSLKRLIIKSCDANYDEKRIQIRVPRLVSMLLDNKDSPCLESFMTPRLERMPELVEATVRIDSYQDQCDCNDPVACYHVTRDDDDTSDVDSDSDDKESSGDDYAGQNTTKSMVLEGLAQARDLVLIADLPTYIFRRDLRWCPTFSKLKTLVLSQVYRREPADCSVLECMLEHAPLLEKLTVTFKKIPAREGKYKVEIKGYPDAKGKSTKVSQYLQIVDISCEDVNGIFTNVLNFLGTHDICFETRVTKKR